MPYALYMWYDPREPELSEGICLYFYHTLYTNERVYKQLKKHLMDHEALEIRDYFLFFKRCYRRLSFPLPAWLPNG